MAQINRKVGSLEAKVETVELSLLNVDNSYQRGLKRHAKLIEANFMLAAAGTLHVGRRPKGDLWLIDGLQRKTAMVNLGIKKWKAIVVESSGPQYEAQIFKLLNGNRVGVNSVDMFRTCLTAQDPVAVAAAKIVAELGMTFNFQRGGRVLKYGEIACLGMLYRQTARWGEDNIKRALNLVMNTWPGQDQAMSEMLVCGVIVLVGTYGETLNDARFVEKLNVAPRQILLDIGAYLHAKQRGAVEVLCKYYNKGMRTERKKLKHGEIKDASHQKTKDINLKPVLKVAAAE